MGSSSCESPMDLGDTVPKWAQMRSLQDLSEKSASRGTDIKISSLPSASSQSPGAALLSAFVIISLGLILASCPSS